MSIMDELKASDPEVKTELEVEKPGVVEETPAEVIETTETTQVETSTFNPQTWFKEKLEIDFEDEAKFKEKWSSLTAAEQKAAQLEASIETEKANAKKLVDEAETGFLKKYNLNENEIRRLLILKEFPDSDTTMLTKIITTDFSKSYKDDPVEVLIAKVRLDDPEIFDNDADAEAEVYRQFGIDPDAVKMENGVAMEDDDGKPIYLYKDKDGKLTLPDGRIKAMQKAAKEANKGFDAIRNKIPIPDKTDLIAAKEKETKEKTENNARLKTQWQPTFKNLADKALTKLKFERKTEDGKKSEVYFEFDVDENYRKEAARILNEVDLEQFISKGVEYSKENETKLVEAAQEELQAKYISKHFNQILLAREAQLLKEWADKEHEDLHNPTKITGRTGPKTTTKLQAEHDAVEDKIGKRY